MRGLEVLANTNPQLNIAGWDFGGGQRPDLMFNIDNIFLLSHGCPFGYCWSGLWDKSHFVDIFQHKYVSKTDVVCMGCSAGVVEVGSGLY